MAWQLPCTVDTHARPKKCRRIEHFANSAGAAMEVRAHFNNCGASALLLSRHFSSPQLNRAIMCILKISTVNPDNLRSDCKALKSIHYRKINCSVEQAIALTITKQLFNNAATHTLVAPSQRKIFNHSMYSGPQKSWPLLPCISYGSEGHDFCGPLYN